MKKIISLFIALSTVLTMSAVAFAETNPVVTFSSEKLDAEGYEVYGASEVEEYDAYAVTTTLTGVDLNRETKVTGKLIGLFEVAFDVTGGANINMDEDACYYNAVYDPDPFGYKDSTNMYVYTLGKPTTSASFPAKNTTVAASEVSELISFVVYVKTGETVTLKLNNVSGNFMPMDNNNQNGSLETFNYAAPTTANTAITVNGTTLVLGTPAGGDDDDDEPTTPTTTEKAVKATTPYKEGLKGIKFFVTTDDTNANIVDKTVEKTVEFNSTTLVEGGNVSVGLKVTGIPSTVNLTITAQDWYGSAN